MSDDQIYADLRAMWAAADPMPEGLDNVMIAAIAADDIDAEFELLSLIARDHSLAGARSSTTAAASTTSRLEFSNGSVTAMLLVSRTQVGVQRIDGWVTPAEPMTARLVVRTWVGSTHEEQVDANGGRFTLPDVPHGLARLWLTPASGKPFATPLFEIYEHPWMQSARRPVRSKAPPNSVTAACGVTRRRRRSSIWIKSLAGCWTRPRECR